MSRRRTRGVLAAAVVIVGMGATGGCSLFGVSGAPASTVVVTVQGSADRPPSGSSRPEGSPAGPAASTGGVSTSPGTAPASTAQPPTGPVIDGTQGATTAFATPSGNIVCGAYPSDQRAGGWGLRCDVLDHTWVLPPKPADCEFDWGHGTYLENGRAGLTCVSDTVAGSDGVGLDSTWWNGKPGSQVVTVTRGRIVALAYGATMTFGQISCRSQSDGLHCSDSVTGAGFDIAREAYRLR